MSNFHEHAIMLLRYMFEKGLIPPKGISPEELQAAVGLSSDDFENADNYIIQGQFVDWTASYRALTPYGVEYITEVLKHRTPISLIAERILWLLIRDVKDDESLSTKAIIAELKITPQEYMEACQELDDLGFVKKAFTIIDDYPELIPTKEGRLAFRKDFQETVSVPSIQAGVIFNSPVTGGNIQAIASAIDSEIQQNVSSLSPDEITKEIQQTLEKLLGQISEHLSIEQKAAYTQLAADFQRETGQPKPDSGKLRKLLAGLGFLSDLGGAIDLGQEAIQLVVIASPYILLLGQYIMQLLRN